MLEKISNFLNPELAKKIIKENEEMDKSEDWEKEEKGGNEKPKDKKESYTPKWPKILGKEASYKDGSIPLKEEDEEMRKAA